MNDFNPRMTNLASLFSENKLRYIILRNKGRKATISKECKVSCPSEARADIARVEIVASFRVTYKNFHNLFIVNSAV